MQTELWFPSSLHIPLPLSLSTGLNPLIYTISSVILLGTLAIVSIITCWIRARRSFQYRQFRPDSTPQDYLDYISENEFTPLTTSEFLASLEQRPPTYNQSEELESVTRQQSQDVREGGENQEGAGDREGRSEETQEQRQTSEQLRSGQGHGSASNGSASSRSQGSINSETSGACTCKP